MMLQYVFIILSLLLPLTCGILVTSSDRIQAPIFLLVLLCIVLHVTINTLAQGNSRVPSLSPDRKGLVVRNAIKHFTMTNESVGHQSELKMSYSSKFQYPIFSED